MAARTSAFGLLNIHKPQGPTSHDIVARVRRGTGVKKVGHAGTLDPMATGVLIVCLGQATRLSEYAMGSPKTYRATVRLGVETDTYDAEGTVLAENARPVTRDEVDQALAAFRGDILQTPPMYSAIKQGGKKLYELARQGEEVERAARPVSIYGLDLVGWEPPQVVLDVHCSPGTYIRSLAHDLGAAVGVGAHLTALERIASGAFTAADATVWDDFEQAMADGTWRRYLLPADRAVSALPALSLTHDAAQDVRNGVWLETADDDPDGPDGEQVRAYDPDGTLLAILVRRGARWKPHKVFSESQP